MIYLPSIARMGSSGTGAPLAENSITGKMARQCL
jgi:hypothetical protein